jgi:DNA-binding transcriptional MerR regulator
LDKAPDAFRTISEVADELDVPQHVLRFWETRFPHIKPMKRGGGRRYYRPDDVDLLRGIRHLLYGEGYTIRGVQRLLKDQGIKFVQSVWRADAPHPAPAPADDRGEGEAVEAAAGEESPAAAPATPRNADVSRGRRDTSFGSAQRFVQPEPRLEPPAPPRVKVEAPLAAAKAPPLKGDDLKRLRTILAELGECRRLLDAALTEE